MIFDQRACHGYIIKGDLHGVMNYIRQFPEQTDLYNRFMDIFEHERYISYEVDADLNKILTIYQQYYREVFYLAVDKEQAAENLKARLTSVLGITDTSVELDDLEENQLVEAFRNQDLYFMGGQTSGYFGPYIWKTTETVSYEVELPDGVQNYSVKLLDGFITRSWLDYLSFGEIGTGGWTDADGVINCVKSAYDFESESFRVSLLKHEAQHAQDLARDKDMSSEKLEYRAKLVELIYSNERNRLQDFIQEADVTDKSNGHAIAAYRIMKGFTELLGKDTAELDVLSMEQIQKTAKKLFAESSVV